MKIVIFLILSYFIHISFQTSPPTTTTTRAGKIPVCKDLNDVKCKVKGPSNLEMEYDCHGKEWHANEYLSFDGFVGIQNLQVKSTVYGDQNITLKVECMKRTDILGCYASGINDDCMMSIGVMEIDFPSTFPIYGVYCCYL